jgi:hypothetical protein
MIEGAVELVDRLGPERVAHLGPVERDAHGALVDGSVIGDIAKAESVDLAPLRCVEQLGDHARDRSCADKLSTVARKPFMEELNGERQ